MRTEYNMKYLKVSKIIELLKELPIDSVITPNAVGNLTIYKENELEYNELEYVGFIDFLLEGDIEYDERI